MLNKFDHECVSVHSIKPHVCISHPSYYDTSVIFIIVKFIQHKMNKISQKKIELQFIA